MPVYQMLCHKWRSTILLTFPHTNLKGNQIKRRIDEPSNYIFCCDTIILKWDRRRDDETQADDENVKSCDGLLQVLELGFFSI